MRTNPAGRHAPAVASEYFLEIIYHITRGIGVSEIYFLNYPKTP